MNINSDPTFNINLYKTIKQNFKKRHYDWEVKKLRRNIFGVPLVILGSTWN